MKQYWSTALCIMLDSIGKKETPAAVSAPSAGRERGRVNLTPETALGACEAGKKTRSRIIAVDTHPIDALYSSRMGKATIYIPEDKQGIYDQAKTELGDTISATFLRYLERDLWAKRQAMDRIVVEITDTETQRTSRKAFEGRWLVGNERNPEEFSLLKIRSVMDARECAVRDIDYAAG